MTETASLRDQQAEFTKNLLLEAARKVIIENDPESFTMQKVAREAGVSHRTVYRYFPSRQTLIDEFSEWLEQRFDNSSLNSLTIEEIDEVARIAFSRFDENAQFFEAAARLSVGGLRPADQARRTAIIRQEFDAIFPDLDPATANQVFAVLRHLLGLHTWFELRDRFDLVDGQSGEAVAWALRVLMAAIRAGDLPRQQSATRDGHDP
jgi:AcrR family transcriptional regulator